MQMLMARMLADRDEWPMDYYRMSAYRNREAPVIFWGGYEYELPRIERHTGPATIVWRGNDLLATGHLRMDLWKRTGWRHIATSLWHEEELTKLGLPYTRLNLPGRDLSPFTFTPAGDGVFFYSGDGETYGDNVFAEVKKRLPSVRFVEVLGWFNKSRAQMRELMSDCWLGLRLRSFDGPASTVLEMGMMGRRSVFNGDTPGSISWKTADDVVAIIEAGPQESDRHLPLRMSSWISPPRSLHIT